IENRSGAPARALALALLSAVLQRRRPLDEALVTTPADLPRRDRAFARLLVTTVLRRLGQIDEALARCLEKPLPESLTWLTQVLRWGAAQLVFLGTPPHAAVDGAVAQAGDKPRLRGLANAVLRRLAHDAAGILGSQDAERLNTPDWLWESWCAAYGEATT